MVGGNVVYGASEFAGLAPPPLPVLPDWSRSKCTAATIRLVNNRLATLRRAPASRTDVCTACSTALGVAIQSHCGVWDASVLRFDSPAKKEYP